MGIPLLCRLAGKKRERISSGAKGVVCIIGAPASAFGFHDELSAPKSELTFKEVTMAVFLVAKEVLDVENEVGTMENVRQDSPLMEMGLDSLAAVEFMFLLR